MTRPNKVNGIDMALVDAIEETKRRSQECCRRKSRYADENAARASGCCQMESGRIPEQLYFYKCKWCRGFHLTRQEQPEFYKVDYYFKGAKS